MWICVVLRHQCFLFALSYVDFSLYINETKKNSLYKIQKSHLTDRSSGSGWQFENL